MRARLVSARQIAGLLGHVAWQIVRRHFFTLSSALVLAVLTFLVLSSDSFESKSESTPTGDREAAVEVVPRPIRPKVLFYIVEDGAQRDALASAVQADRFAIDGPPPADYVVYLLAGTPAEEAQTIARLNFEEFAAQQSRVDMRVIDVRPRED